MKKNTTRLMAVATAILMASTSAFAAVKNGASLKGNEYTKGGSSVIGGGVIAWNEYSSVDPTAFSHDLASSDLTVLKDGDYLVAVTVPLYTFNGQRNTQRADLMVNGTAVPTGLGESSYIRWTNNHSESSDHFAVLVSLKANDVITVKTTPTAANATQAFIATCSLYAELVEGNRNVFSASATEIQSGAELNVEPDTGDQGLVWTSARKGSAYSHTDGNAEITFEDDGNYMVYANVPLRGNVGRGSVGLTLNLDEEYIDGARGQQGYIRNANNHKDASIHFSGMIRAEAGQVLTVTTEQLAQTGSIKVQANRAASIFIEKLRNDGLFSDSFTETISGENLNPASKTALSLTGDGTSLDIIDNTTYSNEGDGEENIVIKKAGNYLLTFNVTLYSGGGRVNPRFTVEVNGDVVPGATSLSHYIRNSNGHNESTGSFVALLNDLAVDDVVTVSTSREGNTQQVTSPEGGKVALQAKAAYTPAAGDTSPPKLASIFGLGLDGFEAKLEDFGLSVDAASIKAIVNGAEAAVTTSKVGTITTVAYAFADLPDPYSTHTVTLSFSDSGGNSYSKDLGFTVDVGYKRLPASFASTSVDKSSAGFIANVTQISTTQTEGANNVHGNNTANAEKQLAGLFLNPNEWDDDDNNLPYLNEADPDAWDGWSISPVEVDGVINWNQDEGAAAGNFGEDQAIPQIPGWGDSSDGIVAEMLAYLELSKGLHTLGVNSDDGFKVSFGPNPKDLLGIVVGEFNGGRGAADSTFNIVAEADGLYPVRLLWYEGGGGANVEFFSVTKNGVKILINDPDNPNAIKAYRKADSAPYVSRVAPAGGELSQTFEFDITNGDLSVDKSSVKLKLNGEDASVTTKSTDDGISVVYDHGDYIPGGDYAIELSYTESDGTARVRNHSISIPKGRIDILLENPTVTVEFDDLTGPTGVGAVGNPGLTYVGSPEFGVPALYPNGVGTAVRFDGSKDQRLRVADHPDINVTNGPWEEMSWEFWFKAEKLPTAGQTITLYEQGGNTRGVHLYLSGTQDSDPTEAEIYMMALNRAETFWGGVALNQVGDEGVTLVKSTVKVGSVYHVAFVMDGDPSGDLEGTLTGYINGRQVGQVSGVHLLYNHSDDIAFAYAAAQAVTHYGDTGEQPGLGFTGVLDDAAFYDFALSAEQVAAHFEGGFASGQAIEITAQPQDATAQEANTATFSVEFSGTPLVDVKWLVNGEEAATDAAISGSSFSIVASEANNGAKIKAELTNSVGTVTTAEVTLTSVVDKAAPEVASANAVAGTINEVNIAFNEIVNAETAANAANYTIAGLTVNSASLGDDGKTVTLSTSQQTPGSYTVAITGVKDVSVRENTGDTSASVDSAIDYSAEVISDDPVIYWKLAETEGTVANDETGNRTGTYVSASGSDLPTLGADSLVAASQDGAVHFNPASEQLMRVGDHAVMNVGGPYTNKSIEFWFKADSLPKATPDADFSPKMLLWEQGGGWKAMIIYLNGTQDSDDPTKADLHFMSTSHIGGNPDALWGGTTDERAPTIHAGHTDSVPVFTKTEVEVGKTYYVVAVLEGDAEGGLEGKLKLYVNGSLAAETGGVGELYNHGNDAGMGGINAGSIFHDEINDGALLGNLYHFHGTIDEFAEYNAVLTDDQIAVRYEIGNTSTAPEPEAPAPAELPWSVGLNDDGWPAGDGGGPNTTFVQETGTNELPGNPANGEGAREGDDDYYWAGDYSTVIAGNGDYTPVGKVMANEESAERAFAGEDNDLRYHFNLPDTLKSTDQLSVSYDALNLHGGQADSRYGIEVYVNNVQVQSEVVIRSEQLGQTYETDPFTLASVNAEVGPGYDNIITLKGVNYNAEGGGNWMGIDYVELSQVDDSPEQTLLFGDTLDSDNSGNWAIHKSTDDTAVTFGYDYSADGIPAAPNSDGSTVGVKFEANIAAPTGAEAVSISPVGLDLKGNYEVQFDMWINANGPFPGGGGGSTEFLTAGVGTTGDHLQWAADTADGAWFGVTGEGGSGNSGDFRAHIGGTRQAAESGAYAAGSTADSRNNTNAHYADAFPGQSPPAAQATAFPGKQTGALQHGAVGFAWRQVTITKVGDSVTWAIDGVTIATLDQSLGAFTTEGNIFVGYYDAFSSVSDNPATSFGLVDNIQVVEIETTLPPALSIVNNGDGTVTVTFEGRLEAAATVNGPWQDSGLTSPATIPADQAMQYGRAVK